MRADPSASPRSPAGQRYALASSTVGWAVIDNQTGGPVVLRGRLLDGLTFNAAEEIYRTLIRLERRHAERLR